MKDRKEDRKEKRSKGKTRKKKERNLNAMNSLPKIRKTRILFISYFLSLTSIFTFFFFGEIRNLTTFCLLPLVNNGFSLSSFFLSLISYLWIGAQFPQEKFLSYGRILTLHYYFLLMCILISQGVTQSSFDDSYFLGQTPGLKIYPVKISLVLTSYFLSSSKIWFQEIILPDVC